LKSPLSSKSPFVLKISHSVAVFSSVMEFLLL
jgi:hypothetical protein